MNDETPAMRQPALVTVEDVVWYSPPEGPLAARLYRPVRPACPVNDALLPAVVSVHGGRWCAESRLTNEVIDKALAAAGVFVMAIDFRMPPAVRYPLPVADINLAIRWLKAHAALYRIDARAIGGVGTSSGGHQLLLNALRPTDPQYSSGYLPNDASAGSGAEDATLAWTVACWAVCDPVARYRHALANDMQVHVDSHRAYWRDEQQMAEGSPQRIVEAREATHLPPLLMIQGTADKVLTPDMADRFADAYAAAGGEVELVKFDGEAHTFITKDPAGAASQTALQTLCNYVVAKAKVPGDA